MAYLKNTVACSGAVHRHHLPVETGHKLPKERLVVLRRRAGDCMAAGVACRCIPWSACLSAGCGSETTIVSGNNPACVRHWRYAADVRARCQDSFSSASLLRENAITCITRQAGSRRHSGHDAAAKRDLAAGYIVQIGVSNRRTFLLELRRSGRRCHGVPVQAIRTLNSLMRRVRFLIESTVVPEGAAAVRIGYLHSALVHLSQQCAFLCRWECFGNLRCLGRIACESRRRIKGAHTIAGRHLIPLTPIGGVDYGVWRAGCIMLGSAVKIHLGLSAVRTGSGCADVPAGDLGA